MFDFGDYISGNRLIYAAEGVENTFPMKIDRVPMFLQQVAPRLLKPFNIVTHWGDYSITAPLLAEAKKIPNFRKWFGQNVDCEADDSLHGLPIGLEDSPNNLLSSRENSLISRTELLHQSSKIQVDLTHLVYANFYVGNYPSEREQAYSVVMEKPWALSKIHVASRSSVGENQVSVYLSYLNDIKTCHYVLCPRGGGIDTHRVWETLYMGRIPVVKKCHNTRYYADLPILFIEDWNEVNERFLLDSLDRFRSKEIFNMEKMKMSWWKQLLIENNP